MLVYLVHVGLGYYQRLADFLVLLHACQGQGALSVLGYDARVGSEFDQELDYLEMVIDRSFHESGEAEVVFHIDVKDLIPMLRFLPRPVLEKNFHGFCETVSACDMQGVATICIHEIDVDILLKK